MRTVADRWVAQENYEENKNIAIENTALHQVVHIFGCKNSVVRITGKINAVTMGESGSSA